MPDSKGNFRKLEFTKQGADIAFTYAHRDDLAESLKHEAAGFSSKKIISYSRCW